MTTAMSRETLTASTARRLRGILAEYQISGSALARAIGYPQSAISRRTRGQTDMTIPEIEAISAALGISPVYLIFGEGEPVRDYTQLGKMIDGTVPPAGFEPAAFCSDSRDTIPEPTGFTRLAVELAA